MTDTAAAPAQPVDITTMSDEALEAAEAALLQGGEVAPDVRSALGLAEPPTSEPTAQPPAPPTTDAAPASAPATDAAQQPQEPAAEPARTVPLEALLAERRERQRLQDERMRLQGEVDALRQPAPQTPPSPTPTPQEKITALQAQIDAVWERADKGELTLVQARREERALQGQLGALVIEARRPPPEIVARNQEMREQAAAAHPVVSQAIAECEAKFPWLSQVPKEALEALKPQAEALMRNAGLPIDSGDPVSRAQMVRSLTVAAYNAGYGTAQWGPPAQPAQPAQPQATAKPTTIPTPPAQPPLLQTSGVAPTAAGPVLTGDVSLQDLSKFTDADLAALEKQLLGVT